MSIDPQLPVQPASYTGRYYALPLRGRLTPYEGGSFSPAPSTVPEGDAESAQKARKKGGFSFAGFLDMINPLQHIPIVSSLYRRITGDEITPVGRIAGDTLFFGVIGLATSLVNTAIEKVTGKDAGDHVMTALLGETDRTGENPAMLSGAAQDKAAQPDDGVNNALAATAQPEIRRGRVTVIPKDGIAPQTLDAATLDALARTIGGPEALAHLTPKSAARSSNNNSNNAQPDTHPGRSATAIAGADAQEQAAAVSYNDALIRMQQGLERYQAQRPGLELKYAD